MDFFRKQSLIMAPAKSVFAWHEAPDSFVKLIPPWEHVRIVERNGEGIKTGTRLTLEITFGPLKQRWIALHSAYEPGLGRAEHRLSGTEAAGTDREGNA